ncbi:immunity 52 family protein [Burkholderia vietnamiensis]|uniref:immunity 52 family protein n=1 Tax=Burkholderia vietnamiensis TaxID=60552 RepID=UPI0026547706|nr:immunity 52 family protein [Burkholderia vietnamiensis]MDN8042539.1 immunity 52 family protein [Burkholderia vietnamiensis]HDR9132722.1 immunity 52 family protein [Burkholderia vietnamiensis]HDR9202394.1 immunity 52 family protein [Burkholderia vietnamiensis]
MEIIAQFRNPADFAPPGDFAAHLVRLWPVVEAMSHEDERLAQWWLKADTEEEARLYPMYEAPGIPSTAVWAVLAQRYEKKMDLPKVFGFWNGQMDAADSARLKLAIDAKKRPSEIEIGLPAQSAVTADKPAHEGVAKIVFAMVSVYDPMYVSVSPREYFPWQVFDDKPGVGWMLYLPKVTTAQQVPEACELIPVPEAGRLQTGMIIVSVPDAVFSVDNSEHVEVANRIEIRLVDQDLLPAFTNL